VVSRSPLELVVQPVLGDRVDFFVEPDREHPRRSVRGRRSGRRDHERQQKQPFHGCKDCMRERGSDLEREASIGHRSGIAGR
jgi:hypothetical protein